MGYWKKVQVELDEMGDSTDGIDIEKEMREAMMEDKLHCDGCNLGIVVPARLNQINNERVHFVKPGVSKEDFK